LFNMTIKRSSQNPIVVPGGQDWRKVATFNPGVIFDNGKYYMYERVAGSLKPFQTCIGLQVSEDGVNFELASAKPIWTGDMCGYPEGSVEDARVTKLDGKFLMVYAMQPYQFDCWPTGVAVPDYYPNHYPEWEKNRVAPMITRSGIAESFDGIHFKQLCWTTPAEIDDRDNALFPEKINGRYALLRRPMQFVGPEYGAPSPGIWMSTSENLLKWSDPRLVATAEQPLWEGTKIGAAASPLKTDAGWLVLYHGVDANSIYRVGSMMLDLNDPTKVIGRTKNPIMEPTEYYEKFGLVIPNVVFPTANLIVGDDVWIYYGCCDTAIGLATVKLDELIETTMKGK
jgi:beta-1,2-mannobiose phosphorylase / 1,2-beta-oligomannan phosphorylase